MRIIILQHFIEVLDSKGVVTSDKNFFSRRLDSVVSLIRSITFQRNCKWENPQNRFEVCL